MPSFEPALCHAILMVMISWINESEDERMDPRTDNVELCREICRSVLGTCGLHRMTAIFGEAWQIFTILKSFGPSTCALVAPLPPLNGAVPSPYPGDFHLLGEVKHASMLEEELAAALDLLNEWVAHAEYLAQKDVATWIQDLRFHMVQCHFALLHRFD